jgi:hypothetical protein
MTLNSAVIHQESAQDSLSPSDTKVRTCSAQPVPWILCESFIQESRAGRDGHIQYAGPWPPCLTNLKAQKQEKNLSCSGS